MIEASVMHPNTPECASDQEYYRYKHMPLVKARLGDAYKDYTIERKLLAQMRNSIECGNVRCWG